MYTLELASIAAFSAAALLVFGLAKTVTATVDKYSQHWITSQRNTDSWISASLLFTREVLSEEGLELAAIRKMFNTLKKNVIRANYTVSAEELLGQILLEGLMIFVVLLLVCPLLFGPVAIWAAFALSYVWVMWLRPSFVEGDGEKRSRAVYRRLPYALDLGVLVLQSGGTLRDALEIIGRSDDPLAEEIRTAIKEIDSGAAQASALQNMSSRIGVSSLDSIVLAINRGAETGAPMAHTLATQAELFREKRLQEIEKTAVEAPTKMTFPNMLVMGSVIVIVLGPVLVKVGKSGMI